MGGMYGHLVEGISINVNWRLWPIRSCYHLFAVYIGGVEARNLNFEGLSVRMVPCHLLSFYFYIYFLFL